MTSKHLILAPNQWKVIGGVKVENVTDDTINIDIHLKVLNPTIHIQIKYRKMENLNTQQYNLHKSFYININESESKSKDENEDELCLDALRKIVKFFGKMKGTIYFDEVKILDHNQYLESKLIQRIKNASNWMF